ncbi:OLC1v1008466C1 [Oldenlandia corymbosa var. corymbosa]|uniref:OLC1v1008466C1 n=1 Tax=Oldenlandia corymbosa var. corymbosa TaxID=529605 RepID=A0AAV1DPY4_OLDCO|nr:OLC1v1008466C1 [Oldenlandia corymbosa var. corymbosa]
MARGSTSRNEGNGGNEAKGGINHLLVMALDPMSQTMDRFDRRLNENPNPRGQHQQNSEGDQSLERFLKFRPLCYAGGHDTEKTEVRLETLEDIYEALPYLEAREVEYKSAMASTIQISYAAVVEASHREESAQNEVQAFHARKPVGPKLGSNPKLTLVKIML